MADVEKLHRYRHRTRQAVVSQPTAERSGEIREESTGFYSNVGILSATRYHNIFAIVILKVYNIVFDVRSPSLPATVTGKGQAVIHYGSVSVK